MSGYLDGLQAATWWPLAAVFGLFFGSFLNVVSLRWLDDRGLSRHGRSRCPSCKRILRWYELIPVISYAVQGGRCRRCQTPLTPRYLLVELGTATVFGLMVWTSGYSLPTVFLIVLSCLFIIALLVDLDHMVLPDSLTGLAFVVTLLGLVAFGEQNLVGIAESGLLDQWWVGGIVAGGFLGLVYLMTRGRGMGLGDVKLAPVLGFSLGGAGSVVMLATAFVTGAVVGVGLLATGRATRKTAVPFGPFLIVGWLVAVLWGGPIVAWYTKVALGI